MKYIFTDVSTHIDLGFGVTGDQFRNAAEFLNKADEYSKSIRSGEMPTLYLYRHSIELYLKSLITIFHRELQLPYKDGEISFNNDIPFVYDHQKGKWIEITKCHDIYTLYTEFLNLVTNNKDQLEQKAPDASWNLEKSENIQYVNIIKNYDFDSTYFRYPFTKNRNVDKKKYSTEKVDKETLIHKIQANKPKKETALIIRNEKEEFVEAHRTVSTRLTEISKALKELSYYFSCVHIMVRVELCEGW